MGTYYNQNTMKWEEQHKPFIPQDVKCLCWLSECYCQFQRHSIHFTFCVDPEIYRLCLDKEDINYGS